MLETHALLLTDVVDSTRLSAERGAAAIAELWARHDRVARDLLDVHRGREIDKTDGFLLLFDEVADAVGYARDYHAAIEPLGLSARAGVHVGPVVLTANDPQDVARGAKPVEVDGVAKPVAARVMALARGGQTLVTAAAREALGDAYSTVSHGFWRLKGLPDPLELFEVDARGVPPEDGAKGFRVTQIGDQWVPVAAIPHALPAPRDAFVGRTRELTELCDRFERGARVVSVLGVGGSGKTRLVSRFAWTWLGDWPGGAWFCDLVDARGVEDICAAVARTLDLPAGGDPVTAIGQNIASRGRCLVVLDNFEQLSRFAGATLGRWLDRAPRARFLVTTREVLGLPGEEVLALAPLSPQDATDLFVERASRVSAVGAIDPEPIRSLVELLDRLPLAIELAAARARVMSVEQIRTRLDRRFQLLASKGGRATRQATLRASLDWSWELLTPDEQRALAQLAVFEGGFTLEAAEAILELDEEWPTDAVQGLVDKSLVVTRTGGRLGLLVTVHEYARERLDELGENEASEARHGAFFAAFPRKDPAERDNLLAAWRRAIHRGDGAQVGQLARRSWWVVGRVGPFEGVLALARASAALPDLDADAGTWVAFVHAAAAHARGRSEEAVEAGRRAIALGGATPTIQVEVRKDLAHALIRMSRLDEAQPPLLEALAIAGSNASLLSSVHDMLGLLRQSEGRHDEAESHFREAIRHAEACGRSPASTCNNLGVLLSRAGRDAEALALYEQGLAAAEQEGDRRHRMNLHLNRGVQFVRQGDSQRAHADFVAALAEARKMGAAHTEAILLGNLGSLSAMIDEIDRSEAYFEQALALHRRAGLEGWVASTLSNLAEIDCRRGHLQACRERLGEAIERCRASGTEVMEGPIWVQHARLAVAEGRTAAALEHLDRAESLLRKHGDHHALAEALALRAELESR